MKKVLMLEFNELCPILMKRFMDQGELPNFQKMYSESSVYTTDAGEDPPSLNPWIQWVSVHTGQTYGEHQIYRLADGHKLKEKCLWDLVSDKGHPVGIFGSMNIKYRNPINGVVLPDPWSSGVEPYPAELKDFYRFIQSSVQDHTKEKTALTKKDYFRALRYLASHGLKSKSIVSTLIQLWSERFSNTRWKRATILDQLQLDLFECYWKKEKPVFSTFFSNSTAHFQHVFWRNFEPEKFQMKPNEKDQESYKGAVLFGYKQMDKILSRVRAFIDNETSIVFCTGLSQQACLDYEETGGKVLYRPHDFTEFLNSVGIENVQSVSPVMSEQMHIHFETELEAERALKQLQALRFGKKPLMRAYRNETSVFGGCGLYQKIDMSKTVTNSEGLEITGFDQLFYLIDCVKSGSHKRDGILWVLTPEKKHEVHTDLVPIESIAPTVLDILNISKPDYMKQTSLLSSASQVARAAV